MRTLQENENTFFPNSLNLPNSPSSHPIPDLSIRIAMEQTRAIVAHAPDPTKSAPGSNWFLQDVSLSTQLNDGEVLVEMVATGICHTDLSITAFPDTPDGPPYPRVPGHEGSGRVRAVGPNVTKNVQPGDLVLLSYDHCQTCHYCKRGRPMYCETFMPMNLFGSPGVFQSAEGKPIGGKCFGQSSFAQLSIVKETSILPAQGLVRDADELKLFAPLGCGVQTGAGAILNLTKPGPDDRVMVLGLGGVGLSAIMASGIAKPDQVVAVDRVPARLDLAKTMGATHSLDTTGCQDLVAAMREATEGLGPTIVIETTGVPALIEAAYASLANEGTLVFIGAVDQSFELKVPLVPHLSRGVKVVGCVLGNSLPEEVRTLSSSLQSIEMRQGEEADVGGSQFLPRLVQHYREGKFPIDKITKFYPATDFQKALHDVHAGDTIKACLVW